MKMTD